MSASWFIRRLNSIKRSGRLIVSNEPQFSIEMLSDPEHVKLLSMMKYIDISMTKTVSLQGLVSLPHLQTFIANSTQIANFENFQAISSVSSFSLKNTPVSKHPHYKLSLCLVIGSGISTIDGKVISQTLKNRVEKYPPIAGRLVNMGWMAEYPVPAEDRFRQLADECELTYSEHEIHPYVDEDEQEGEEEMLELSHIFDEINTDFEDKIQLLRGKHEEMIEKGMAIFALIDEDKTDDDTEVAEKISSVFKSHKIEIDSSSDESILQAVADLCSFIRFSRAQSTASEVIPDL